MNRTAASSRRRFLQRSVFATGASVLGFPAVVSSKSPNSKMNIGFIAAGGRGGSHVAEAKKMPDLVMMDVKLPDQDPSPGGTKVCPSQDGATNWYSPSFNPSTGLY